MRVFVTGASGWIGSATVEELLAHGHQVTGLARSDASASVIEAKGADVLRGDLDDLNSLKRGAGDADAVIHLANKHDWADSAGNDRAERLAVETMLAALTGTNRPFVVANALSGLVQGRSVTEADASPAIGPDSDRGGSENLALGYATRGVRTMISRFAPSVHGEGDWGFLVFLADAARKHGVSGYIGDGSTAWSAIHRSDAARMLRLGIEKAPAGTRLHAVAEEAITTHAIAEALGKALGVPVVSIAPQDAAAHFGFVAHFFGQSMTASSTRTRELLDWTPEGPGLIDDILSGSYGSRA